jgi:hypothetical protein
MLTYVIDTRCQVRYTQMTRTTMDSESYYDSHAQILERTPPFSTNEEPFMAEPSFCKAKQTGGDL